MFVGRLVCQDLIRGSWFHKLEKYIRKIIHHHIDIPGTRLSGFPTQFSNKARLHG